MGFKVLALELEINNASFAFRMPSLCDFISSRGVSSILLMECFVCFCFEIMKCNVWNILHYAH